MLIRFAGWSLNVLRSIYYVLDAILAGFWLGVLSEKSIERYNDLHYDKGTSYTNDIYNLSGLQGWEYERIKKFLSKAKTFMIIGAGGGRETAALRKWEREVDSYECSRRLVDYANDFLKRNNIDAEINYLPKNSVPELVKKYDAIIFGWGAYTHIQGSKSRIALLSALQPFCREDTQIMVSFMVKEGQSRKDKIIKSVSNFFRTIAGRHKTEAGDRLLSYYAHFFDRNEIEHELNSAGFQMLEYTDREYGCVMGKAVQKNELQKPE